MEVGQESFAQCIENLTNSLKKMVPHMNRMIHVAKNVQDMKGFINFFFYFYLTQNFLIFLFYKEKLETSIGGKFLIINYD